MRYLGLDLGTKTIGIALSDRTNTLASALKVIDYCGNTDVALQEIKKLIEEYNITHLVLGLPKNMDNSLGFAAKRSLDFKKLIETTLKIPVELMDERLTTVTAQNILLQADVSLKKRKKVIDSMAASVILNDYLKMKGN